MNERALARVRMEAALRRAIDHKEFLLHYQPKVNLQSRLICGFERCCAGSIPTRAWSCPGNSFRFWRTRV